MNNQKIPADRRPPPPPRRRWMRRGEEWNRKFAQISPESVKIQAESLGVSNLTEDAIKTLAEDLSYRLRELLQRCSRHMKLSHRKKLRCVEVNEVLTSYFNHPPMLGHHFPDTRSDFDEVPGAGIFIQAPSAPVPIFTPEELKDDTLLVPVKYTPTQLTGHWVAMEDIRPRLRVEEHRWTESPASNGSSRRGGGFINAEGSSRSSDRSQDLSDNEPVIPAVIIKYYAIICNALLGSVDAEKIYKDLTTNDKILPIIPFMLKFLSETLSKIANERQVMRLLQAVDSLTANDKIDFRPYHQTHRVANSLSKIIRSTILDVRLPLASNPGTSVQPSQMRQLSYSARTRVRAAQVLTNVVKKWSPNRKDLLAYIGDLPGETNLPFRILGADKLRRRQFLATVPIYLKRVEDLWNDRLTAQKNVFAENGLKRLQTLQEELNWLQSVLMEVARVLYRNPQQVSEDCPSSQKLDELLFSTFGPMLSPLRLNLLENPKFFHRFVRPAYPRPKSDGHIMDPAWKLPKCLNSMYNPTAKRLSLETAFELLEPKKNPRIILKFQGSNPVPEISLKRRRVDSKSSQFIPGSLSEGHVVLCGRFWKRKRKLVNTSMLRHSLLTVL